MNILYTDNDPFCCAWLEELIKDGQLPDGDVLCADVRTLQPDTIAAYSQQHHFAGIGGWPLALKLTGWYGPVWTASCPCQPFSAAGKRQALSDDRDLWPAFFRLIAEHHPAIVFSEQVEAAIKWGWLDRVYDDLEREGYACGAAVLPACAVGAPHIRNRLFWVAVANGAGSSARNGNGARERHWNPAPTTSQVSANGVAIAKHAQRRAVSIDGNDGRNGANGGRQEAYGESGACGEIRNATNRQELPETVTERDFTAVLETSLGVRTGARHHSRRPKRRIEMAHSHKADGLAESESQLDGSGESGQGWRTKSANSGASGGLGNADAAGLQGWSIGSNQRTDQRSPWTASQLIHCRDGKYRRIPLEREIFPLASNGRCRAGNGMGASSGKNRTQILKGAGNAIVPALAAEFIKAVMDNL